MLDPDKVIEPEVLVIELLVPARFIPTQATPSADPGADPVREIGPFPVIVETRPVPEILIPLDAWALCPAVPFKVIEPPPVVLNVPPVRAIP